MKNLLKRTVSALMIASLIMTNGMVSAIADQQSQDVNQEKYVDEISVSDNVVDKLGDAIEPQTVVTTLASTKGAGELTWSIDSEGRLHIKGAGTPILIRQGLDAEYNTISISKEWPWTKYASMVREVYVELSDFEDASYMFAGMSNAEYIYFTNFDTSETTNMAAMFKDCSYLNSINLSGFDTSKVTNMSMMFDGCECLGITNLSNTYCLNLSKFDTSNVEDMSMMFRDCSDVDFINVSSFDTSKVQNMSEMFAGCEELQNLNIDNFITPELKNMEHMFLGCDLLENLDLSKFDTSEVEYMEGAFDGCESLETLNISGFSFDNIYNDSELNEPWGMFDGCSELDMIICPQNVTEIIALPTENHIWKDVNDKGYIYLEQMGKTHDAPYILYSSGRANDDASLRENVILSADEYENGKITPNYAIYDKRATANFQVTPNEGYRVKDILVDNKSVLDTAKMGPTYKFRLESNTVSVGAIHNISAVFEKADHYIINASAGANGTITEAGESNVKPGDSVKYTFEPDDGYAIYQVIVDGKNVGAVNEYSFNDVSADHSIKVLYKEGLLIAASVSNVEKNSPVIGGTLTNTGLKYYLPRTTVTFIATPDDRYDVYDIAVDGDSMGGIYKYVFEELDDDHIIYTRFVKLCEVTAISGEHGKITPEGLTLIKPGYDLIYNIKPDSEYLIDNIYIDGKKVETSNEYVFKNIKGNHTISANFFKGTYKAFFDPNGGTVNLKAKDVLFGAKYGELPIAEKRGMEFKGWYSAADGGTEINSETIFSEKKDVTLYAHYQGISISVKQKYDVAKFFKDVRDVKKYKVIKVDTGKASISKRGVLKASKAGHIKVVPCVKIGKKTVEQPDKAIEIEITKPAFSVKKTQVKMGETKNIAELATGLPAAATNEFIYSVPNKKKPVAKIDRTTGVLTPIKKGKVKVTLTVKNKQGYSCKAYITVKVLP